MREPGLFPKEEEITVSPYVYDKVLKEKAVIIIY